MRVLIVDDHPLFAEGLGNFLAAHHIDVAGIARDGHEGLLRARALRPELVLMDVAMPGIDGIAATRAIKAEFPDMTVIMLTQSAGDDDVFEAIAAGASGYLLKSESTDSFLQLLAGAARGEAALSPAIADRVLREFARLSVAARDDERGDPLTDRQREVLRLVASGLLYKQVAALLGITERAVKYHMGEILARLHLENRAEATAYARRSGIVR
jgi:DNA-binding NarL/FixJ family response regulator